MMIAKCVECHKKFSKASNLYRHRREQHGTRENIEKEGAINESYCVSCNKYFKRKEHYHIHMNAIHLFKDKNVCSFCDYSTFTKSALRRHLNKVHSNPFSGFNIKQNDPLFCCKLCTKKFSTKRALDYHLQKKHGIVTPNLRVKRNCPLCGYSIVHSSGGKANKMMYDHFFQEHGLYLDIDFLESEDLIAFYNWKANLEKSTSSKFNRSNRKAKKCFRFTCYRSGMFSSKGKRVLRTIRSCKINAFCPAAIIAVLKDNGKVQVTFIKTHVGHKNDTWTETSKKKIQLKMKATRNRHKASLSLSSENVYVRSDGEWQIPSPKGNCYFSVRKIQASMCENCATKCCHCNACFHQYTCSCSDFGKKNNMCKHIHLVAKLTGGQEAVFVNEDDLLVINESCDENLVVIDIPQEEEEDDGEEIITINPPSEVIFDEEVQEFTMDSAAVEHYILGQDEVTAQTSSPSSPQKLEEAKEEFAEQLLAIVRNRITSFQELGAVQDHCKFIDSILNTLQSNPSDVDIDLLQSPQEIPSIATVTNQTLSNSISNTKEDTSHSATKKEIICFKVISSKSDEKHHRF